MKRCLECAGRLVETNGRELKCPHLEDFLRGLRTSGVHLSAGRRGSSVRVRCSRCYATAPTAASYLILPAEGA